MEITVIDDPQEQRYTARDGDTMAGLLAYRAAADVLVLTHTEVDPSYEGRGVGSRLVREVLDDVRARDLRVVPRCPFVQGWIERHADYQDLVDRQPPSTATDRP